MARNTIIKQTPLVITPGEPAGIGPELAIQLAQNTLDMPVVCIASADLLAARAREIGLPIKLTPWNGQAFSGSAAGELVIQDVPLSENSESGHLNPANANYVLACLNHAIDACLNERFAALVTGPLHKGLINEAGIPFSGHTEYLQTRCDVNKVVMMLASPKMKVALATTHLPIADVPGAITQASLAEVIEILIEDLQSKFGCERPRILVAGLNPHAGEGGHLGREELDVIIPVLDAFNAHGADLVGPLPADTLFSDDKLAQADAVLAMYHDQGLPVLKYDGFGEAVNITLGLPIIRTSVDHGTALDLAGTGQADPGSLRAAINMANSMSIRLKNRA